MTWSEMVCGECCELIILFPVLIYQFFVVIVNIAVM